MTLPLRALALVGSAALLLSLAASAPSPGPEGSGAELTIFFTHDIHSQFAPSAGEKGEAAGGLTRLAAVLEEERARTEGAVLTVDAGDFSMGTLVNTLYTQEAPELRALGAMGYDAVTLGNHEFDLGDAALGDMLQTAADSGDPIPALVTCNLTVEEGAEQLSRGLEAVGAAAWAIFQREGIKIGVVGLMGDHAAACVSSPAASFAHRTARTAQAVDHLRRVEECGYVIVLSHSGTSQGAGEDAELARQVDGIDVIVSGHSHTVLDSPLQVGDTLIVSAGCRGEYLGRLELARDRGGRAYAVSYQLLPVEAGAPEDQAMAARLAAWEEAIDGDYLAPYGLTCGQVLSCSPFSLPVSPVRGAERDTGLGNLAADSFRWAAEQTEGDESPPVDFALVSAGALRSALPAGDLTVEQVFSVLSQGTGADGTPGSPLVSVYLLGRDLEQLLELDASLGDLLPAARLYGSGLWWSSCSGRLALDKLDIRRQVLPDGTTRPLEPDRLYRVVTLLSAGQLLENLAAYTGGVLSVTLRDERGQPVEDLSACVLTTPQGAEWKGWYALARYLEHLGTVPQDYAAPQGRKLVSGSWDPARLAAHPGAPTAVVLALTLGALAWAAVLLVQVRRQTP